MLLEVLDDIILLSYRQSAGAEYFMEHVSLKDILHKVHRDFKVQAQKKNITMDLNIPSDLSPIQADLEALDEVFSNLVNNAIKYTKRNGKVSLSAIEKENTIEIDVFDTGIGITTEELPKIFNEFYRGSNVKSNGIDGTGVGLTIVKEIVEVHQGEIKVRSELEKGSSITVILPHLVKENK